MGHEAGGAAGQVAVAGDGGELVVGVVPEVESFRRDRVAAWLIGLIQTCQPVELVVAVRVAVVWRASHRGRLCGAAAVCVVAVGEDDLRAAVVNHGLRDAAEVVIGVAVARAGRDIFGAQHLAGFVEFELDCVDHAAGGVEPAFLDHAIDRVVVVFDYAAVAVRAPRQVVHQVVLVATRLEVAGAEFDRFGHRAVEIVVLVRGDVADRVGEGQQVVGQVVLVLGDGIG